MVVCSEGTAEEDVQLPLECAERLTGQESSTTRVPVLCRLDPRDVEATSRGIGCGPVSCCC